MQQCLALTTLLVHDYDDAIVFFVEKLGFSLVEDSDVAEPTAPQRSKRWVVVTPAGSNGSGLLLAKASDAAQIARIGDQAGGRVFLFLYTDDFWRDYELYRSRGVEFVEGEPREEPYGIVAVFKDVLGNHWDLIQPADTVTREKSEENDVNTY